jgi:hypothetical protein
MRACVERALAPVLLRLRPEKAPPADGAAAAAYVAAGSAGPSGSNDRPRDSRSTGFDLESLGPSACLALEIRSFLASSKQRPRSGRFCCKRERCARKSKRYQQAQEQLPAFGHSVFREESVPSPQVRSFRKSAMHRRALIWMLPNWTHKQPAMDLSRI